MRKKVNKKLIVALLSFVLLFGGTFGSSLAWLLDKTENVQNTFSTSDINIELKESKLNADGLTVNKEVQVQSNTGYKMIPGHTIEKDPVVTVKAGSEDCWVFIKVEENGGEVTVKENDVDVTKKFDDFISYGIDPNNWEQLKDKDGKAVEGVYVTKGAVKDIENDRSIKVLGYYNGAETPENFVPNTVRVKDDVTKEMMEAFDTDNDGTLNDNEKKALPVLTFTAYASQFWKSNDESFSAIDAWNNVNPNP